MKKVFLFIADGFEEVEAVTPLDYLRRSGADLTLVGVGGKTIRSSRGLTVACDAVFEELIGGDAAAHAHTIAALAADTAMVILPGGLPNSRALGENTELETFVKAVVERGGFAAAICAAPALALGKWGLLNEKRFTCYPGMGEDLGTLPVKDSRTVHDGQFITACGAGAAEEFSFALVEALYGEQKAVELKQAIVAR